MKFSSISEFVNELDNDITDPYQIAKDFKLKIIETDLLSNNINAFCEPTSQVIFINKNINNRFKLFVLSHEIIHALLDYHLAMLENNTVNTLKTESRANNGAFYILERNFKAINDISLNDININCFMQFYNIPTYYFYFVEHYFELRRKWIQRS